MITPLENYPKLASAIGISGLYLKREDLHLYGSHKGRSIPMMIDHYRNIGDKSFAISSSGNAALAAALHVQKLNSSPRLSRERSERSNTRFLSADLGLLKLDIFVGNHVSPKKLQKIRTLADESDENIRVLVKERPLQALTQVAQEGVRSLRQSTDDEALVGYVSLAEELAEDFRSQKSNKIGAIFIGTSSGTTAQALADYFIKNKLPIQVHIVQTSSCHPIAESFESYDGPDERSIADAITDITGHRKSAIIPLIEKTGGRGWIATNEEIEAAQALVRDNSGLEISTNSALSIVGIMKAVYLGHKIEGSVVGLICGE